MDQYIARLIALRGELRYKVFIFCDLIEANDGAIEANDVAAVRDLIAAALTAIDEIPIA